MDPKHILFVCMANIVRSPVAENLFRSMIQQRGIEHRFTTDSAGTTPGFAGHTPHPVMTRIARRHGIHNPGISRTLTMEDLTGSDLILVMDQDNHADLMNMAADERQMQRIQYLREFHPGPKTDLIIDNPIMGTESDFEQTFFLIRECVSGLVSNLEQHS